MAELGTTELISLVTGSTGGVFVMATSCWAWFTNRIVTRQTLKDQLAEKDKQLAEKDETIGEWKAAYALERQRADTNGQRADAATMAALASKDVLAALHREIAP